MDTSFLFYCGTQPQDELPSLPPGYHVQLWRPSKLPWSGYAGRSTDLIWSAIHWAGLFSNRDLAVCQIWRGPDLVHRSSVFPKYFRYPFMEPGDLQIGATWTAPDHRGRRLAVFAVNHIVASLHQPQRRFWYVVSEDNTASIAVIEKCGFRLLGKGVRTKRFGLRLLGAFELSAKP